jgi:hypothetical protein
MMLIRGSSSRSNFKEQHRAEQLAASPVQEVSGAAYCFPQFTFPSASAPR